MRKGQEYIAGLMSLVMAVIIVFVLKGILPGQEIKITPEVEAQEFENKAILLANSLLANPNLIYSKERALFDEEKLNTNMINKLSNFDTILFCPPSPNALCKLNSYPESFTLVLIKDSENERGWLSLLWPKEIELIKKISSCFESFDKNKVQLLFEDDANIPKILNLQGCGFTRNSNILSETFLVGGKKVSNLFPVSIRYSNGDVYMGWIKVMVVE